jgi:hypothetical protein
MAIRASVFSLLACVAATSGCAVDNDPLGLDDLAPYGTGGDAGKGDDANCTDETYRAFIKPYMQQAASLGAPLSDESIAQLKTAAAANPCASGNDASYRIWAYAARKQLTPLIERYDEVIQNRFRSNSVTPAELETAGTLDEQTRATLAALAFAKPAHAGKVGYGEWANMYESALITATTGVGYQFGLVGATGNQQGREIVPFENEWLTWIEANQPIPTAPVFAIWWSKIERDVDDMTTYFGTASEAQRAIDHTFTVRLGDVAPDTDMDADGEMFQKTVTLRAAEETRTAAPLQFFTDALAMKPRAGGPLSYKAWATAFAELAPTFNDSPPTPTALAMMATIVAARPCASGADVDTLSTRLHTRLASAGDDGAGHPLADVVVPTACVQ